MKLFLTFAFVLLSSKICYAQQSVPLDIPNHSYDSLYTQKQSLNVLAEEIDELTEKIDEIEDARSKKKTKILFFDIPCCGSDPLGDEARELKNMVETQRQIKSIKFGKELADYRESLRAEFTIDELATLYSKNRTNLTDRHLGLIPNNQDLLELEKSKELVLSQTLNLPDDPTIEDYNYLVFKTVSLPKGVTLTIKASGESEPLVFQKDQLADYDGFVGPLVGRRVEIFMTYSEGTSKKNLIYIRDILTNWEGAKRLGDDLNYNGGPEQQDLGIEASGFECGGTDRREPIDSQTYPFVGRLVYNGNGFCSAFLVKDDLLVTAGHCIAAIIKGNRTQNSPSLADDNYSKVHFETFTPVSAWNDGVIQLSNIEHRFAFRKGSVVCDNCIYRSVSGSRSTPPWSEAKNFRLGQDWAYLKVLPKVTTTTIKEYRKTYNVPSLKVARLDKTQSASLSGRIVGYGKDMDADQEDRNRAMQFDDGVVNIVPSDSSPTGKPILRHNIHTQKGSSGSPIFSNDADGSIKEVIGIHTHGFCSDDISIPINVGTVIDSTKF